MKDRDVLMFLSSFDRESGGPASQVTAVLTALKETGRYAVTVVTGSECSYLSTLCEKVVPSVVELSDSKSKVEIAHVNGVWNWEIQRIAKFASKRNAKIVVHPRGMLMPKALSYKKIKKKIAWFLFQRNALKKAHLFVATSHKEYECIRSLGFVQPVAIIPNGVDLSCASYPHKSGVADRKVKTALFLSRLHPIKGLEDLITSWRANVPSHWRLKIVGPGEASYVKKIAKMTVGENSIEVLPAAYGSEKSEHFISADFFILPSLSENFGNVIIEAMSFGLPVITTTSTPWTDLDKLNLGFSVDPGLRGISLALEKMFSLSDRQLNAMGEKAREFSATFDIEYSTNKTIELYDCLVENMPFPDFVMESS